MKTNYTYLITAILVLIANVSLAQTKIKFIDVNGRSVRSTEAFYFVKETENADGGGTRTYYLAKDSSRVKMYTYSDLDGGIHKDGILDGLHQEWFKSGNLSLKGNYVNGELQDSLIAYFESGVVRRKEFYKGGKMISGKVYNKTGQEEAYTERYQLPVFPGGEKKMLRYLSSNIIYPKTARRAGVEGLVVVVFDVGINGELSNYTILKNLNPDIDAEALRVIKNMPIWKPGLFEGEPVPVRYTLPVRFTIN